MASTLTPAKTRTNLFSIRSVGSNAVAKTTTPIDVSTKWSGVVKVRFGRTSTSSITATELRIEGGGRGVGGANDFWTPIYAWTDSNYSIAASQANVGSTPAANAIALDGTWTGITAADGLVFIMDTNTANRGEWGRVNSVTGSLLTFQDTLTRIHTVTTNKVVDQAEEWNIPVDFAGEETIRMVVDNAKNAVLVPVVVEGILITHDTTNAT